MTVLGSGGPFVNAHRASSSYLIWYQERPRLLVDAGGGTFERLGRVGVDPAELDAVLLTPLHIDHSGGLALIVFAAWMAGRTRPLTLTEPAGDGEQPGVDRWTELLFGRDGAWSYLHSFEGFGITTKPAPSDTSSAAVRDLLELDGLRFSTVAVPHGMMPAVAYRIDGGGDSVTISDVQSPYPLWQSWAGTPHTMPRRYQTTTSSVATTGTKSTAIATAMEFGTDDQDTLRKALAPVRTSEAAPVRSPYCFCHPIPSRAGRNERYGHHRMMNSVRSSLRVVRRCGDGGVGAYYERYRAGGQPMRPVGFATSFRS